MLSSRLLHYRLVSPPGFRRDDFPRLVPDRLSLPATRYLAWAERMLVCYRQGVGRTRLELHRSVGAILSADPACPPRRREAFCSLLDAAGNFDRDRRGEAARLRRDLLHAPRDPIVARAEIAARLGLPWEEISLRLFSDLPAFQRLRSFAGYPDGRSLLARYDVAQLQAALLRARSLTLRARADYKAIFRALKFSRLMHTLSPLPGTGYEIRVDGPLSLLASTRRYGPALARALPALLACRDWSLTAEIVPPGWPAGGRATIALASGGGWTSHLLPPPPFDSRLEEEFARAWGDDPRAGWRLFREGEILHQQQTVFIPDFTFRHVSGAVAHLEIVGFWTPEYLQRKASTLATFRNPFLLLALPRVSGLALSQRETSDGQPPEGSSSPTVLRFDRALSSEEVEERLTQLLPQSAIG